METPAYNYAIVRSFIVWSIIWGVVAVLVGVLISFQLVVPGTEHPPLPDLRPAAPPPHQRRHLRLGDRQLLRAVLSTSSSASAGPRCGARAGQVPALALQRHHHRRGGHPAARLHHLQGVPRTGVAGGHHGGGALGGLHGQHLHDHHEAPRGADVHLPLVHDRHPGRGGGPLPGQRRRGPGVAVQVVLGLCRRQRRQRPVVVRPQRRGHGPDHAAAGAVLLFPPQIHRGADLQPPDGDHRLLEPHLHVPLDRRPPPPLDAGSRLGPDPGHGLLADAHRPVAGARSSTATSP